ncbi:RDD family protein [Roseofilum sp. BLCC_M91]|uniref:RDD family protein n=1 Tax=Roseofilum halophilum BLCC-M91 TaxID=3022259 RepID=A0ABT7BJK3_9CYAN|nr:RDD family protein [Roseofilum halophilum]MDJ1178478.1 RDD family protein [Roseofilum halophilum BLCC-M91]
MFSAPPDRYFPRAPLSRRTAAFAMDLTLIWLFCAIAGRSLFLPAFVLAWFTARIFVVLKNKGQSLGRYAFDLRVVDSTGRTPLFSDLLKREAILGVGSILALGGLNALNPANAWSLLLMLPLGVDCGWAFAETNWRQAFHDQVAGTLMVQSRRGYSLDLKLKQILAQLQKRMRQ